MKKEKGLKGLRSRFTALTMAGFLLVSAQSCVFRVYNWKGVPTEIIHDDAVETLSPEQKADLYQRYAITRFRLTSTGHYIGFSTALDPDITYDLYTYAPIITALSPESAQSFETVLGWETLGKYTGYGFLSVGAVYGLIAGDGLINSRIASSASFDQELSTFAWVYGLGIATYMGLTLFFAAQEIEQYERIKSQYNQALKEKLAM